MELKIEIRKVAIYSRKSRPDETEEALKRQLQVLVDMAEKNNWSWEVFQEVGSSMSMEERDRPELNKMLRKVQSYEYDGILVTDADRLSRDMEHSAFMKKMFQNYGVKLITTTKVYDYNTQEDDLMSDMMAIIAKQEYLNTKKRLMRGRKASAQAGKWQGKAPIGYKVNKETGKLMIDESSAPLIRRIFELYLQGLSSTDIAYRLELEEMRTPMGKFPTSAKVAQILKNEVYIGVAIFGKTVFSKTEKRSNGTPKQVKNDEELMVRIENAHEPIISKEEWEAVDKIRSERLPLPVASRIGKTPFSSLITCGICGRTHSFQVNTRFREKIRIQSCLTRHYDESGEYSVCKNQGIDLDLFEKGFYMELSGYIDELENYLEVVRSNAKLEDVYNPEEEIAQFDLEIKKLQDQMKKAQQAFLLEIMDEREAQFQIKSRKKKIAELEERKQEIINTPRVDVAQSLEDMVNRLRNILAGTSNMEAKDLNALFRTFIEKIEYRKIGHIRGSKNAPLEIKIHYK